MRYLKSEVKKAYYGDELVPLIQGDLPSTQFAEDDKIWKDVITAGSYLPRVQVFGGNSNMVKRGVIGIGNYGLVTSKEAVENLGPSFDCFPMSWRFKAMRIKGENVFSFYDPKGPEFIKCVAESELKDSGCMYGVEFLLFVAGVNKYATFYLASKTARRQAPAMRGILNEKRAATCKIELIERKPHIWHGPVVIACSTPFPLPDMAEMLDQAIKFSSQKESQIETVDTAEAGEAARER